MNRPHAWILLLAVFMVLSSIHPIKESDPFWHLSLGRAVLESQSRTFPEPTSFIGEGTLRIAPEWLWEVSSYVLFKVGGIEFLQLLVPIIALGILFSVLKLLGKQDNAVIIISAIVIAMIGARLRLRPQIIGLLGIPIILLLSRSWLKTRSWKTGLLILLTEIIWAQLHGSFALIPILLSISIIPSTGIKHLKRDLALISLSVIALSTSAYGFGLLPYLLEHASGDAVNHISDMKGPEWTLFINPRSSFGPTYLILWLLGIIGLYNTKPWKKGISELTPLMLALFGLALALNAVRFIADAGILLSPLALQGAKVIFKKKYYAEILGILILIRSLFLINNTWGPLLNFGIDEPRFPQAAVTYLNSLDHKTKILNSFSAGAYLGFYSNNKYKTFVDSRTPLHFGDLDYALARDAWLFPEALAKTISNHSVDILVLDRNADICDNVPKDFKPVVIDAKYTTFVKTDKGLTALNACGPNYIQSCDNANNEISWLSALSNSAFLDYLKAQLAADCENTVIELPPPSLSSAFYDNYERLIGKQYTIENNFKAALDILGPRIKKGELASVKILGPALFDGRIPLEQSISLLKALSNELDDRTPQEIRSDLAWLCTKTNDFECVRFNALRAAISGNSEAIEPLLWLIENHPSREVKEDAEKWYQVLR